MLEELSRDYMIEMLERMCAEADVPDSHPLLEVLRGAKSLADIQDTLRNMMNDPKVGGAFKRRVNSDKLVFLGIVCSTISWKL